MKVYAIVLAVLVPSICAAVDPGVPAEPENIPEWEPQLVAPSSIWEFFTDIIGFISDGFKSNPHIIGGQTVTPHSFPHQVGLVSKDVESNQERLCGGTLIAPQWVLTAAHCTVSKKDMFAVLGRHNIRAREEFGQKINVTQVFTPQDWNSRSGLSDIALMKLETPAIINEYVQTIRLPSKSQTDDNHENKKITVIGWGKFNDSIDALSKTLKSVESKVISNIDCTMRHGLGKIRWLHLCAASTKTSGPCMGDSGGPMLMTEGDGQRTIVGVVSFRSPKNCENNLPTVFTRVDRYLDWIAETTGLKIRD